MVWSAPARFTSRPRFSAAGDAPAFAVEFHGALADREVGGAVSDFPKASLAAVNLRPNPGLFQSGAYAINDLLKPASVIFNHVNEAATEGGKLRANTQTAALMKQVKALARATLLWPGD
jgi:hypothetical protein